MIWDTQFKKEEDDESFAQSFEKKLLMDQAERKINEKSNCICICTS